MKLLVLEFLVFLSILRKVKGYYNYFERQHYWPDASNEYSKESYPIALHYLSNYGIPLQQHSGNETLNLDLYNLPFLQRWWYNQNDGTDYASLLPQRSIYDIYNHYNREGEIYVPIFQQRPAYSTYYQYVGTSHTSPLEIQSVYPTHDQYSGTSYVLPFQQQSVYPTYDQYGGISYPPPLQQQSVYPTYDQYSGTSYPSPLQQQYVYPTYDQYSGTSYPSPLQQQYVYPAYDQYSGSPSQQQSVYPTYDQYSGTSYSAPFQHLSSYASYGRNGKESYTSPFQQNFAYSFHDQSRGKSYAVPFQQLLASSYDQYGSKSYTVPFQQRYESFTDEQHGATNFADPMQQRSTYSNYGQLGGKNYNAPFQQYFENLINEYYKEKSGDSPYNKYDGVRSDSTFKKSSTQKEVINEPFHYNPLVSSYILHNVKNIDTQIQKSPANVKTSDASMQHQNSAHSSYDLYYGKSSGSTFPTDSNHHQYEGSISDLPFLKSTNLETSNYFLSPDNFVDSIYDQYGGRIFAPPSQQSSTYFSNDKDVETSNSSPLQDLSVDSSNVQNSEEIDASRFQLLNADSEDEKYEKTSDKKLSDDVHRASGRNNMNSPSAREVYNNGEENDHESTIQQLASSHNNMNSPSASEVSNNGEEDDHDSNNQQPASTRKSDSHSTSEVLNEDVENDYEPPYQQPAPTQNYNWRLLDLDFSDIALLNPVISRSFMDSSQNSYTIEDDEHELEHNYYDEAPKQTSKPTLFFRSFRGQSRDGSEDNFDFNGK